MHLKKWIALLLLLCCLMTAGAGLAEKTHVVSVSGQRLFSVRYDDRTYTLDDSSYTANSSGTFQWLFLLYNGSYTIDCSCEYLPGWRSLSLQSASESEMQNYISFLLSEDGYGAYQCNYVRTESISVQTNRNQTGSLPFILLKLTDPEYGEVYHMETVTNGLTISFEVFNNYGSTMNSAALNALRQIVQSMTLYLD